MTVELPSVTFDYALVCDDVRREDNGKFIFVGVYGNNILLHEFPGVIRLRLVTRSRPKKSEFPLAIRVKRNGESIAVLKGAVSSPSLEADISPTPEFNVELTAPGAIEFEVCDDVFEIEKADAAHWVPLLRIPVQLAEQD